MKKNIFFGLKKTLTFSHYAARNGIMLKNLKFFSGQKFFRMINFFYFLGKNKQKKNFEKKIFDLKKTLTFSHYAAQNGIRSKKLKSFSGQKMFFSQKVYFWIKNIKK